MKQNKFIILLSICIIILLLLCISFVVYTFIFSENNPFQNSTKIGTISKSTQNDSQNTVSSENNIQNQSSTSKEFNNTSSTKDNTIPVILDLPEKTVPEYNFYFELPINGATGYASIQMNVVTSPQSSTIIKSISPGTAFQILSEDSNWWKIKIGNTEGWVNSTYCMINLPDIIPSIIYDDTNSYASLFRSSEISIPNVTGKKLYDVYKYNERLDKKEYMMPILYSMAKKIMSAQKAALDEGYSLKIYETYRPYETQQKVCSNLKELIKNNKTVYEGIYGGGWSEDWFINQSVSNHQKGFAMDVSLVKVNTTKIISIGKYKCLTITDYTEEKMPTKMHELSDSAVTFQSAISASSKTGWKNMKLAKTMTIGAKRLQKYCTDSGLTPLASEWWHFNDLDTKSAIGSKYSTGKYQITQCLSTIPN